MSVSLSEYEKALNSLKEALHFASTSLSPDDAVLFKIARDACIQRFEYCIELSWKVSVKKLGSTTKFAKPAIREMARAGLISQAEMWLDFIEARNESSHSYNENVAKKLFIQINNFSTEAEKLLAELQKLP